MYAFTIENITIRIHKVVIEPFYEAYSCLKNDNFTASALMCRKLIMNLAVAHCDEEGKHFIEYIDYLQEGGILTPDMDFFFDNAPEKIRILGNDATHKTKMITEQKAINIFETTNTLLSLIYKFDEKIVLCDYFQGDNNEQWNKIII